MKANGVIIKRMDSVVISGQMAVITRATIQTEKETDKEKWFTKMDNITKVSGFKEKNMGKVFIVLELMNLLDSGLTDSLKEK